ncbi:hypothetical protein [Propylenella binzhouense]|uniref:Uncharacterized protein n=1 Tax=Propylenella binzhouense TaxID=2555902 RepID=A0A964T4W9_9HYPH|nr:hypothetical protein [Propylenella binzhouense]MYZ48566.1 hypothetical protein [Propylenella binzhouense]
MTDANINAPARPVAAVGHGFPVLVFVALVGGAAPYLLRVASQLVTAQLEGGAPNIPAFGFWLGIGIFAVLGLVTSIATAEQSAKAYFVAAMAAPGLIAGALLGINEAKVPVGTRSAETSAAIPGTTLGLHIFGAALAQPLNGSATAGAAPPSIAAADGGSQIEVKVDIENASAVAGASELKILAAGAQGTGVQATCPAFAGANCSIWVPGETKSVTFELGGRSTEIQLPPEASQIGVSIEANPSVSQQLWWALGGRLRGEVSGLKAEAITGATN